MKIKGLKEAVKDYRKANSQTGCSPWYGYLMFDEEDGELWTDVFCSLGHNEWKVYHSGLIINLGNRMAEEGIPVTEENVKAYIQDNFSEFSV